MGTTIRAQAAYKAIRRNGRLMPTGRWCFRPRPAPHELLSSWLHRLALANAVRDHTLCKTMWPRVDVWTRDLDRSLRSDLLPVLSSWTGVPVLELERLQLTQWVGRLAETLPARGHADWILPLGVYHRLRRRPGLLYCSSCLRQSDADAVWAWRMAWTTCCRVHKMELREVCPSCDTPYMPHRSSPSLLGRMPCVVCGLDLARCSQQPSAQWAWQFQQRLETALVEGRTQIARRGFFALPFFVGLRSLAALLLTRSGRELVRRVTGHSTPTRHFEPSSRIEFQPLSVRRWVLQGCWVLLQDWPCTFIENARRVGQRHHIAKRFDRDWVFWLQEGVDKLEGCRQRQVSADEAQAIALWLRHQGAEVSWSRILHAAGVSTPTRIPQPGVRAVLSAHLALRLDMMGR